jgi:hypothetical protein
MELYNKEIVKSLDLAGEMLILSDKGDSLRENSGCGVLQGVIMDAVYRIRQPAEAEKDAHIKKRVME